jgi:small GTP-binding protein
MQHFNIALLGDTGTGKTTFINRFMGDNFNPVYTQTPTIDRYQYKQLNKEFDIWDFPGDNLDFTNFDNLYKKQIEMNLAVIFYDVNNKTSFDNVDKWAAVFKSRYPNKKIIMVANKIDLPNSITSNDLMIRKKYSSVMIMNSNTESNEFIQDTMKGILGTL